jgi:hypothetical protein
MFPWAKNQVLRSHVGQHKPKDTIMQIDSQLTRWGKIRYGLAALLLGLPLPVVIIALFWGGCSR